MAIKALIPTALDLGREEVVESLRFLAQKGDGYISPDAVVEEAAKDSSPLHPYFLWDDTEAGRRFRLLQAGMLLRRIRVTIVRPELTDGSVRLLNVRAIQSDPDKRGNGGSYAMVEQIMSDAERRKSLVNSVVKELLSIRRRYEEVSELSAVWEVIDRLTG